MAKVDRLLERGISFAKEGLEATARNLFRAVIAEEPENQVAWGWYVQSFSDEEERIRAFDEYLKIFPQDRAAHQLQAALLKRQYQRWKRTTADALQKQNAAQREIAQVVKHRAQALRKSRLATVVLSIFLIGVLCLASSVSATKINSLSNEARQLRQDYAILDGNYNSLRTGFDSLYADHNTLVYEHNTLISNYTQLQNQYNSLQGKYDWLESIAVTPPYILTNGRTVHMAFNRINGSIMYWDIPFSSLEYNLQRGNALRDKINSGLRDYSLYLKNTNTDETFYVPDYRYFVDSSPFVNVIQDLYYESGDSDAFIREVWNIVAQLTTYSEDITDTPRYPLETLLAGGGDCEDTAILFASMVLAAPVNWKVQLVYMDGLNPTHPLTMNHVSVYVATEDRAYEVETTNKDLLDPYPDGISGWYYDMKR